LLNGSGGGTLELAAGSMKLAGDTTLQFPGSMFQWTANDIDLNGHTLINDAGSTINFGGTTPFHFLKGNGTLSNKGLVIESSTASMYLNDAKTVLDNTAGGVIDFWAATGGITFQGPSGTLTNEGTLRRTFGTGIARIECNFAITNTVDVRS